MGFRTCQSKKTYPLNSGGQANNSNTSRLIRPKPCGLKIGGASLLLIDCYSTKQNNQYTVTMTRTDDLNRFYELLDNYASVEHQYSSINFLAYPDIGLIIEIKWL